MSSFGPVNTGRPKYGECVYCWDENWPRLHGFMFESRSHMIGPVCKHRLKKPLRWIKQMATNRQVADRIANEPDMSYWERRATWPDYCGEPGELAIGFVPPFESWYKDQGLPG